VPADGVGERREQRGGLSDPVGEGGAVEVEPVALDFGPTSTWACKPGPGRPRSMGRDGSDAWTKRSQPVQASRGRTIRFTMKRPGTYSSSSVTSSPIRRSLPPQSAQVSAAGPSSTSIRGT